MCIPTRLLLAYTVKRTPVPYLPLYTLLAIPGTGFLYLYFFKQRQIPPETFGCPFWWNNMRLIHGVIYLTAALLALSKDKLAYAPLMIDVVVSVAGFILLKTFA